MAIKLNANKRSWIDSFYKIFMPKIYGIGASIVITGAMFKLLNWPGGALMLGIGLTTEAIIFFLSAFEPQIQELDWTRVYPTLDPAYQGASVSMDTVDVSVSKVLSEKLDEWFTESQIDQVLIHKLGEGMKRLADSVSAIANVSHMSGVTEQYIEQMVKASKVLENIHDANSSILGSIRKLTDVAEQSQQYYEQIQHLTHILGQMNHNYQEELKGTQVRLEQSNTIFNSINESVHSLKEASTETEHFKKELAQLSEKISLLNGVYGNMLTALKS